MATVHRSLPIPAHVRQIDGLQMLRAVAVCEVLWVHTTQAMEVSAGLFNFGVFGVDLFFVISGFILSTVILRGAGGHGVLASRQFLVRRWLRIFPVYWIFCFAAWLRLIHAHHAPGREIVPGLFLLPSTQMNTTPMLLTFGWTLIFEMFFYYVLAVVLLATGRYAVPVAMTALSIFATAGLWCNINRPILIVMLNPISLEFVMGGIIALLYARYARQRRLGIVMTLCGCALAFVLAASNLPKVATGGQMILVGEGVFPRVGTWGLSAGLIVCGVVFWSPALTRSRVGRLAIVLGSASYSTYLASPTLLEAFMRYFGATKRHFAWVASAGTAGRVFSQYVMLVGMLGLGWACYNFIEWPILRRLQAFAKNT